MKATKNIKVFAGLIFLAGSSFWQAPAHGYSVKGADCGAANFLQALRGPLVTDQFGVRNDSATNSFFTVCGMDHDGESVDTIEIQPLFPATGGTMNCILRAQNFATGGFTFVNVNIVSTVARPDFSGVSFGPLSAEVNPNITVICPLDPGEGLEWLWLS